MLGIERLFTTPYRPQSDGLLEKYQETMCKNLSMYVNEKHDDWDLYLKAVCYSYNTSMCIESTGYSPFFIMFGREPLEPIDTVLKNNNSYRTEVQETILKLQTVREIAKRNVEERQQKMKTRYDQNIYQRDFQPGELVWIHFPEIVVGGSKKFFS